MLDPSGQTVVLSIAAELDRLRSSAIPGPPSIRRKLLHRDGRRLFTPLAPDAHSEIPEHAAPGPVVIQIVAGDVEITLHGCTVSLSFGQLLVLDSDIRHAVRALANAGFQLEIAVGASHASPPDGGATAARY